MNNDELLKLAQEMVQTYEGNEPTRVRWALVLAMCLHTAVLTKGKS